MPLRNYDAGFLRRARLAQGEWAGEYDLRRVINCVIGEVEMAAGCHGVWIGGRVSPDGGLWETFVHLPAAIMNISHGENSVRLCSN